MLLRVFFFFFFFFYLSQATHFQEHNSLFSCASNRRNQEATCSPKQRLLSRRNKPFFLGSRYVLSMARFVERHSPHSDQLSSCHCPRESKCILREMVKKELQGCWRQVVCGEIGLNKLKRSRTHKWTPGRFGQTQMR